MSTALLDRVAGASIGVPGQEHGAGQCASTASFVATPPGTARTLPPTLEGVIVRAWEGLAAHRGVGCPVCGGRMAPRYGVTYDDHRNHGIDHDDHIKLYNHDLRQWL